MNKSKSTEGKGIKEKENKILLEHPETALRVIDKLLSLPYGEQIYAKEIRLLFDLVRIMSYPVITIKS